MTEVPVLHHLKVSNYNEKVRWALDYKGIAHVRKAAVPGRHRAVARRLTGGTTFPVLVTDGTAIGDSSRIIAHLEKHYPDPPLYPADPVEREHALQLEAFFDEELGPYTRLLLIHHILPDAQLFVGTFVPDAHGARLALGRLQLAFMRRGIRRMFGLDMEAVAHAFGRLRAAGARFRSQLQPNGHLVSDRFSVADLTLAALVAPIVAPDGFPYPQPQREHSRLAPVLSVLAESGLTAWTRDMYKRERRGSAAIRG